MRIQTRFLKKFFSSNFNLKKWIIFQQTFPQIPAIFYNAVYCPFIPWHFWASIRQWRAIVERFLFSSPLRNANITRIWSNYFSVFTKSKNFHWNENVIQRSVCVVYSLRWLLWCFWWARKSLISVEKRWKGFVLGKWKFFQWNFLLQ